MTKDLRAAAEGAQIALDLFLNGGLCKKRAAKVHADLRTALAQPPSAEVQRLEKPTRSLTNAEIDKAWRAVCLPEDASVVAIYTAFARNIEAALKDTP